MMKYTIYLNTINTVSLKFKLSEDLRDLITSYLDNNSFPIHYLMDIVLHKNKIKMNFCIKESMFFPLNKNCPCIMKDIINYDNENNMTVITVTNENNVICMNTMQDVSEFCGCHHYCNECEKYFYDENTIYHNFCIECETYICIENDTKHHDKCIDCDEFICENEEHNYCSACEEITCEKLICSICDRSICSMCDTGYCSDCIE